MYRETYQKLNLGLGASRRSARPLANPDLFKPTPTPPHPDGRKVSFQEGPPEEIGDLYRASPNSTARAPAGPGKQSKWQPLSAVDPSPVTDADPFSLGDSDDEKDAKTRDSKLDEDRKIEKTSAEALPDTTGSGTAGLAGKHETSRISGSTDGKA